MNLSTFQTYLTSKAPLATPPRHYLNGEEEQQLLKWAASLPVQSENEQASQLEQMLTELSVAEIDDELRLRLMSVVMTATERLVAALRKHYIYEIGPLSDSQLEFVEQVKSLYYLNILVFDAVVRRERLALNCRQQQRAPNPSAWKRLIKPTVALPFTLAIAIYQSLLSYQKLLYEKAICYQNPPLYIWSALNQLYYLACQHNIAQMDLTSHVVTRQARSIHQLYCQICLHSLLNVLAMRRPSILLIQRLLPEWSLHISATLEPQTQTRIFIDLKSDCPPEYLTPVTVINPYEEHQDCLFIELEPLAAYFRQRQNELLAVNQKMTEYRLITKILMAITHRYINRQMNIASRYSPKKRGTVITCFNDIHYHVAGKHSLMSMIAAQDLSAEYLPRYDTAPRKDATPPAFEIEMYDCTKTRSTFRTLRLLTAQDIVAQQGVLNSEAQKHKDGSKQSSNVLIPPLTEIFEPITMKEAATVSDSVLTSFLATAPPRLCIMSLFLLCHHQDQEGQEKSAQKQDTQKYSHQADDYQENDKENWSLGMVRWLTIDAEYVEAEAQILGNAPTACALRLDNRDNRSQSFIPALLLAAEDDLQTTSSLLVPSYHFKVNDKVIIRLNGEQKPLRLQQTLLSTEEFTQYEVVRL
ncbi:hypothetical protein [Psychrobacter urativorans]|uniref:GTPase n=1 Tax=Psychrobacter urativorans TaxID=45610 RepID=A0A0M4TDF9_9GAMM|nr:hypothetical protein [Psychrobacter urativorans]ALF60158.1 hypothetical protein AOC03_09005 [Psychrobacter urativorans]